MRLAEIEGLRKSSAQPRRFQSTDCTEQRQVRKVLDPRVRSLARECICMKFFGEMRLHWVEPKPRRLDSGESEDVLAHDDVRLPENRVGECDVDTEVLSVDLAGQLALGAMTEPGVALSGQLHCRLLWIRLDLERHEVSKVQPACLLKLGKRVPRRPNKAQVHISRRPGPLETNLEDQASLQHRGVAQHATDAREKPVEHEQLPVSRKLGAGPRGVAQPLLQ